MHVPFRAQHSRLIGIRLFHNFFSSPLSSLSLSFFIFLANWKNGVNYAGSLNDHVRQSVIFFSSARVQARERWCRACLRGAFFTWRNADRNSALLLTIAYPIFNLAYDAARRPGVFTLQPDRNDFIVAAACLSRIAVDALLFMNLTRDASRGIDLAHEKTIPVKDLCLQSGE